MPGGLCLLDHDDRRVLVALRDTQPSIASKSCMSMRAGVSPLFQRKASEHSGEAS